MIILNIFYKESLELKICIVKDQIIISTKIFFI